MQASEVFSVLSAMRDELNSLNADELILNGCGYGYFKIRGTSHQPAKNYFESNENLSRWLQYLAYHSQLRLDPLMPSIGGKYQNLRWHAVMGSLTGGLPLFSLRNHRFKDFELEDFGLEDHSKNVVKSCIQESVPILIFGSTGCGKTTLLAHILSHYCSLERVFILETIEELSHLNPHWVQLSEKVSNLEGKGAVPLSEILKYSLRLTPDRIVVGEIRGHEGKIFLEAQNLGHGGSLSTIHASSPRHALLRLAHLAGLVLSHAERVENIVNSFEIYGLDRILLIGLGADARLKTFDMVLGCDK